MEVKEPGKLHIGRAEGDGKVDVLMSDDMVERFVEVKRFIKKLGIVELSLDHEFLPELAERLIGYLSFDAGPISVSLGLLGLALYELLGRMMVRGYEITPTPAIVGKAVLGKTQLGRGGYTLSPVDIG